MHNGLGGGGLGGVRGRGLFIRRKRHKRSLTPVGYHVYSYSNNGNFNKLLSSQIMLINNSLLSLYMYTSLVIFADAPAPLNKELNMVLTLQGDINTIEKNLQNTRRTISQGSAPKDSIATVSAMEQTQQQLQEELERLYTSLNVHNSYPELQGMSLEFVRTLLLACNLKINIHKCTIASFFEWDKLHSMMRGKSNPLGK